MQEGRDASLFFRIVCGPVQEHADATHPIGLLRARAASDHANAMPPKAAMKFRLPIIAIDPSRTGSRALECKEP
jgi:hypothetical protein